MGSGTEMTHRIRRVETREHCCACIRENEAPAYNAAGGLPDRSEAQVDSAIQAVATDLLLRQDVVSCYRLFPANT